MTTSHRRYIKSSHSGGSGSCVEWATTQDGVFVRDSKNPDGHELLVSFQEWDTFVAAVDSGADHPWIDTVGGGVTITKDDQQLHFTPEEWAAFVAGVQAGEAQVSVVTA